VKVQPKASKKSSQDSDETAMLHETIKVQRARFDELAAYLIAVTEKHAIEKAVLMKKIDTLEREARKTARELKGLRYLVMNGTGSGVYHGSSPLGSSSLSTISVKSQGCEDSIDIRAGSKVEVSSSDGSTNRPLPDTLLLNVSRPASLTVPVMEGKLGLGPDPSSTHIHSLSTVEKRSSVSSFSSVPSAASSTSSLPLPGPTTTASTVSSGLSAIPETRMPSPESTRDPAVAAAILAAERQQQKEERRASRALRRLSSSSTTSSASAASSAYAANLSRGRPPSIAQVLGESSSMEDVLEKLRPFATSMKGSNS
jgi:hypothetical protein